MSAPEPSKLYGLWQQARIKVEQAMGYSLQNDLKRDQTIATQQQQLNEQRDTIRP